MEDDISKRLSSSSGRHPAKKSQLLMGVSDQNSEARNELPHPDNLYLTPMKLGFYPLLDELAKAPRPKNPKG